MGSPAAEKGREEDEGPQKKVKISPFSIGTYEVTHDEFLLFMNDDSLTRNSDVDAVTRPTPQYIDFSLGMGKQGGFPVNSMSQHAALMYCRWLYQKNGNVLPAADRSRMGICLPGRRIHHVSFRQRFGPAKTVRVVCHQQRR